MSRAAWTLVVVCAVARTALVHAQVGNDVPIAGGGGGGANLNSVYTLTFAEASPAQLTTTGGTSGGASYDDYSGCALTNDCRLSSNGSVTIDGFTAAAGGFDLRVCNVGSNSITLAHQNTGSTAANRIINGLGTSTGALAMVGGQCTLLKYDGTTTRWRILSTTAPNGLMPTIGGTFTNGVTFDDGAAGPATIVTTGAGVDAKISMGTTGRFKLLKAAESSTAEILAQFDVADATAVTTMGLINRTTGASTANYSVGFYQAANALTPGIQSLVLAANDTGTTPVGILQCGRGTGLNVLTANQTTRSCWAILNNVTDIVDIDSVGNIFLDAGATKSKTGCTLNGGSPSTCTVTVAANAKCQCTPVGTTAAIAAGGCAVSLSSTTLTATSANGLSNAVNITCW